MRSLKAAIRSFYCGFNPQHIPRHLLRLYPNRTPETLLPSGIRGSYILRTKRNREGFIAALPQLPIPNRISRVNRHSIAIFFNNLTFYNLSWLVILPELLFRMFRSFPFCIHASIRSPSFTSIISCPNVSPMFSWSDVKRYPVQVNKKYPYQLYTKIK